METIQIQVSSELARRLRPYQRELPRILEWGLRHVETETEVETRAESVLEAMALQKRVVAALRRAGAVGSNPEEMVQYLAQRENQRWTPIQAGGRPASEMIIEERDSRP
ncbi:MAG: hypothetical protein H8E47_08935 [Anaerolineales bacterium]|nr:hypothetical protein [Anaerolineales bacterium]